MGRPHSPIDPQQPLAEFASGLLALKIGRNLTYKQMAEKGYCSASRLSEAARGVRLPTLEVTLAYVRACVPDKPDEQERAKREWTERWLRAGGQLPMRTRRAAYA